MKNKFRRRENGKRKTGGRIQEDGNMRMENEDGRRKNGNLELI